MRTHLLPKMFASAVVVAATVVGLVPAASALPAGDPNPPDTTDRPDLKLTALAASPGSTGWSVSYTVANAGQSSVPWSTLSFGGGPGFPATNVAIPSLASGGTRSGTVPLARGDCYVYVVATADAAKVVTESSETNNTRTTIGAEPGCPPRYKVSAAHFKAIDESGDDWAGSDEIYWAFSSVSNSGTAATRNTQVYGSLDTGDTQSFSVYDNCVWGCSPVGTPAPFGIGLSAQVWEHDQGDVPEIVSDIADAFQAAGPILSAAKLPEWVGTATTKVGDAIEYFVGVWEDDLLGTNTYAFSADGLASALPNRGSSFLDTRVYDANAKYSLTMVVSRLV
ncbi:MAG: CARDB domain-containing protein [Acidimicrobiales bacterium]